MALKEALINDIKEKKDEIIQLSAQQCTIKDIQENIQKNLENMNEKIKELEILENEAANNEDFELAAKYSDMKEEVKIQIVFTIKELDKKSEEYLEI